MSDLVVSAAEWESWQPTQADRDRWELEKRRWLQHNGWHRPSLHEWRMYAESQARRVAVLEAELSWQRLETIRARAGL